jgi:DNA-binding transcriptional regulator/RsmH inhibitor MraZ
MQGDVTVLGSGDYLEVWNRERLRNMEKLSADDHSRLSEFGI